MSVNFICVGAQKAGTTAFFDMIKNHPEVSMSSIKEVHYFDIESNYKKGMKWYNSFFNDEKKIIGECTPDYLLYNSIPKKIEKTLGTKIKLLFILRNPIERAYSQYNFHIMKGVEFRDSFSEIIDSEILDKENKIYNEWYRPSYYLSRGLYANQIKRYLDCFPKDNMHFVLFEELFGKNQQHHFNAILDFLEVDHLKLGHIDIANQSMIPKKGLRKKFLNGIRKNKYALKIVKTLLPEKLYFWFHYEILSRIQKRPDKLSPDLKVELNNQFFKEDILKLEKIINKDLSSWLK